MRLYTVLEPPERWGEQAVGLRTRLVPSGFAWLALLFPIPWLFLNGMWLVLVLFVLVNALAELVATQLLGASFGIASVVVNIVFAFEARGLRTWALEKRGWRRRGVVSGLTQEDAERRWFDATLGAGRVTPPDDAPVPPAAREAAPWGDRPATTAGGAVPDVQSSGFMDTRPAR